MPRAGSSTAIPTMSPRSPISGPSPAIPAAVTRPGAVAAAPAEAAFGGVAFADRACRAGGAAGAAAGDPAAAAMGAAAGELVRRAGRHPARRGHAGSGRVARRHGFSRSEEHTSELQSLMRISYAVFCLKKKNRTSLIILCCHSFVFILVI